MTFLEIDEKEIKRLRNIKLIAKWFLGIQSIWTILLAFTISYGLKSLIANKGLLVFAILFFYFTGFWILTLSIILLKSPDPQSISSAKTKLIIVFVCGIIPTMIGLLSTLHSIFIK
jgi:hypothetical protein